MDKTFLYRLESTLVKVRQKLLLNDKIRTLLYYDSADLAEKVETPAMELVAGNILLRPVIEIDNDELANKKLFIAISMPAMNFTDENAVDYAIKISIMADKTMWNYVDENGEQKIRLYQIAQEVINELDGEKFDTASALLFEQMLETTLDKTITGKSLLFSTDDGVGDVE